MDLSVHFIEYNTKGGKTALNEALQKVRELILSNDYSYCLNSGLEYCIADSDAGILIIDELQQEIWLDFHFVDDILLYKNGLISEFSN